MVVCGAAAGLRRMHPIAGKPMPADTTHTHFRTHPLTCARALATVCALPPAWLTACAAAVPAAEPWPEEMACARAPAGRVDQTGVGQQTGWRGGAAQAGFGTCRTGHNRQLSAPIKQSALCSLGSLAAAVPLLASASACAAADALPEPSALAMAEAEAEAEESCSSSLRGPAEGGNWQEGEAGAEGGFGSAGLGSGALARAACLGLRTRTALDAINAALIPQKSAYLRQMRRPAAAGRAPDRGAWGRGRA